MLTLLQILRLLKFISPFGIGYFIEEMEKLSIFYESRDRVEIS